MCSDGEDVWSKITVPPSKQLAGGSKNAQGLGSRSPAAQLPPISLARHARSSCLQPSKHTTARRQLPGPHPVGGFPNLPTALTSASESPASNTSVRTGYSSSRSMRTPPGRRRALLGAPLMLAAAGAASQGLQSSSAPPWVAAAAARSRAGRSSGAVGARSMAKGAAGGVGGCGEARLARDGRVEWVADPWAQRARLLQTWRQGVSGGEHVFTFRLHLHVRLTSQVVGLEVQVVDGAVGAQRVEGQPEVGVVCT